MNMASWSALGIGSLVVGAAIPMLELFLLKSIRQLRNSRAKLGTAIALPVLVGCLLLGSIAWIWFASLDPSAAPVIAIAGIAGLGLVRWRRGEL